MLRAVVLTQYRRVTDGRTDGIAVVSTALAMRRAVKKLCTIYECIVNTRVVGSFWVLWSLSVNLSLVYCLDVAIIAVIKSVLNRSRSTWQGTRVCLDDACYRWAIGHRSLAATSISVQIYFV